jgi:triosephosphate isomerase (TIM)
MAGGLKDGNGGTTVSAIRPLVAGNWKMHGLSASLAEVRSLLDRLAEGPRPDADILICPPATLLFQTGVMLSGSTVLLGAQDCHPDEHGAHTGDISAEMLADAGAKAVIVGHSERRTDHSESDAVVAAKAAAAHRAGLQAIICIGETGHQRRDGETLYVVRRQLESSLPPSCTAANTVIAYEPVWAIGTGWTPTPEDVAAVHEFIRDRLCDVLGDEGSGIRILYGGSVKPSNARELLAVTNVDGALVGGASLKATDFYGILSVYSGT